MGLFRVGCVQFKIEPVVNKLYQEQEIRNKVGLHIMVIKRGYRRENTAEILRSATYTFEQPAKRYASFETTN